MNRPWRVVLALSAAVAILGFLGVVAVEQAMAQAKGPADFDFAGGPQGKVSFSHEKHVSKSPKCTDCHTKIFKMAKGQRSTPKMAEMEKGQSCGTCHDGTKAFGVKDQASCAKCHKK